jgi:Flp pilus assembly protein TadG
MIVIEVKSDPVRTGRRRGWRKPSGGRGRTFVELGLIASAFLVLCFLIMWLSLAVYAYNSFSYLAREGSRYAAVHGTDSKQPVTTASAVSTFVQNESRTRHEQAHSKYHLDSRRTLYAEG